MIFSEKEELSIYYSNFTPFLIFSIDGSDYILTDSLVNLKKLKDNKIFSSILAPLEGKIIWNNYFILMMIICLLPPTQTIKLILASLEISPFLPVKEDQFNKFISLFEPEDKEACKIIYEKFKESGNTVGINNIQQMSLKEPIVKDPINYIIKMLRSYVIGSLPCKQIINRNKHFDEIVQYQNSHNNKFPSDCCMNQIFRYLFDIPHPYKYDFALLEDEDPLLAAIDVVDKFIFTVYTSKCSAHCFLEPPINRTSDKPQRPMLSMSHSSESSICQANKKHSRTVKTILVSSPILTNDPRSSKSHFNTGKASVATSKSNTEFAEGDA